MDTLKPVIAKYLEVTKRLNDINARASELRDERRTVELDLAAAYASVPALPDKIGLNASQMIFSVKKPGEWKKGWTLSKKQLEEYLLEILPDRGEEVMREIVRRHEEKLVATDYSFDLKAISMERS